MQRRADENGEKAKNTREEISSKGPKHSKAPKEPKQKKRRPWRWLWLVLIALIIVLVCAAGALYAKSKNAADNSYKPAKIQKARDVDKILKEGKPFSVLLLGTDTGELGRDYKGRTDSMMLVTVNPKEKKTTIMSIPRDTLVAIPGFENQFPSKINGAYEDGSAATTIQTVQNWLNVPIDFYALVNMGGLEKVVNQVGGIQVKSPLTFSFNPDTAHADPGNLYDFTKGSSTYSHTGKDGQKKTYDTMDGKAALAFSRMRYADPNGDYGRQERQRLVMQGILDKIKKDPTKVLSSNFIEEIGKSTQTDMKFSQVMKIGMKYLGATQEIKSDHIQGNSYSLSSGSTEVVYRGEQQRATDVLRKSLDLPKKETGNLYSGNISDADIQSAGVPTLTESMQLSTGQDSTDVAAQTADTNTGEVVGQNTN
ncbi:LCP family protein [Weissella uvarum]|nr:LCP family protein [Weissella uvarum]